MEVRGRANMFYGFRQRWRHFGPRRSQAHERGDFCTDVCISPASNGNAYEAALQRVKDSLQRRPEVKDLDKKIEKWKTQAKRTNVTIDWLTAFFAQAPRSVLAQVQMDKHPHGYHDKQARLFELIDFNDTFEGAVLSMNDEERAKFAEAGRQGCDQVCKLVGVAPFDDEQWGAILKGLSRELAVYLAAQHNGFYAYMTSRAQDAMGIDMQIKDPESGAYINIDVKAPSAFRHRLEELVHEDRLNDRELVKADEQSYALITNGHGDQAAQVVLLSVLEDKFGEVENFRFHDEAPMRDMLGMLIDHHGLHDNRYGQFGNLGADYQ